MPEIPQRIFNVISDSYVDLKKELQYWSERLRALWEEEFHFSAKDYIIRGIEQCLKTQLFSGGLAAEYEKNASRHSG